MPRSFSRGTIAACGAALLVAIMSIIMLRHRTTDSEAAASTAVQIVAGGSPTRRTPASAAPQVSTPVAGADDMPRAVLAHFPVLREARLDCEDQCKLIMALGLAQTGPSPFGGNLERFLVERGYALNGKLVVDQPGDNDTLLTIAVVPPGGAR